nr:reverse transcriptase domain-containing protein [Tanacetum cinerariifolium]
MENTVVTLVKEQMYLWKEKTDKIAWIELKRILTNKYCPRTKVKKMEDEFYNLVVKENDLKTYIRRFQELALLCPNMVPNSEKLVEVFIGGLPRSIEGNVTATKPQTLEEAITITQRLMEQIIKHNSAQKPMIINESLRMEETPPPTTTTPMIATTITAPTIATTTTTKITPNNNNNNHNNDYHSSRMERKPSRIMETVDIMDLIPCVRSVHCIT